MNILRKTEQTEAQAEHSVQDHPVATLPCAFYAIMCGLVLQLVIGLYITPRPVYLWLFISLTGILAVAGWASTRFRAAALGWYIAFAIVFVLAAYLLQDTWLTAHALPAWTQGLTSLLGGVLGVNILSVGDGMLTMVSATGYDDISVTIEKIDHTVALALLLWVVLSAGACRSLKHAALTISLLLIAFVLYMPVRLIVISAISIDLAWTGIYWNPIVTFLSYAPLALMLNEIRRRAGRVAWDGQRSVEIPRRWKLAVVCVATLSLAIPAVAFSWPALGERRAASVLIDDAYSNWSWADGEFGEDTYAPSQVYTYRSFRNMLSNYWDVAVNIETPLADIDLSETGVLILKTATKPYAQKDIDAVEAFVRQGGGLLLISDHTDLFGMSTHMNPLAERFGIQFNTDDQFDLATGQPTIVKPWGARRELASLGGFEFLTSCTIVSPPGSSVVTGYGMGSEPVDYSHVNFFGDIEIQRNERWGAFTQIAMVNHGKGRVLAFADSTCFSDFCLFDPLKPTLSVLAVDILNRDASPLAPLRSAMLTVSGFLLFIGIGALSLGIGRMPLVTIAIAASIGAMAFGVERTQRIAPPISKDRVDHVRIHTEYSYAKFPAFLDWSSQALTDPLAFDQYALIWLRLGVLPFRSDELPQITRPLCHIIIYPNSLAFTEENLEQIISDLDRGEPYVVLCESLAEAQQLGLARLCDAIGVDYRFVPIGSPDQEAEIIELTDATENWIIDAGLRFQRSNARGAELIILDGASMLSRREIGQAFSVPEPHQRALCDLAIEINRYILGWSDTTDAIKMASKTFLSAEAEIPSPDQMPMPTGVGIQVPKNNETP